MADGIRYRTKSVQTLRGTESGSIAKARKEGWELVRQDTGRVRTTLHFRKPKRVLTAIQKAAIGVLAVVCAVALAVGAVLTKDEDAAPKDGSSMASEAAAESNDGEYVYRGPAYQVVSTDRGVTSAGLSQYWVVTKRFDRTTPAYRSQVKAIIADVARQADTDELLVEIVTDKEIALAGSPSTTESFVAERGTDYVVNTISEKERTDYVAGYRGGVDPDSGEASDSDAAYEISWYLGEQSVEQWRPRV